MAFDLDTDVTYIGFASIYLEVYSAETKRPDKRKFHISLGQEKEVVHKMFWSHSKKTLKNILCQSLTSNDLSTWYVVLGCRTYGRAKKWQKDA